MINKIKKRHRYRSMFYNKHNTAAIVKIHHKKIIIFPQKISLDNKFRNATLLAVDDIHKMQHESQGTIHLDFSKTNDIEACGMIMVYAALHNLTIMSPFIKLYCLQVNEPKIAEILQQVGIYRLCKQRCKVTPSRSDVIHWRICCGSQVDGKQFDKVIGQHDISKLLSPDIELYAGFIEAIKNAKCHAYLTKEELQNNKSFKNYKTNPDHVAWWCFSQIKDEKLSIVICDLGHSIPATLPISMPWLYALIGRKNEAKLIVGAIEKPRSRLEKSYRGNGLAKIASLAHTNGAMKIFSGLGGVFLSQGNYTQKCNYKKPVRGTIVSWSFPLGDLS